LLLLGLLQRAKACEKFSKGGGWGAKEETDGSGSQDRGKTRKSGVLKAPIYKKNTSLSPPSVCLLFVSRKGMGKTRGGEGEGERSEDRRKSAKLTKTKKKKSTHLDVANTLHQSKPASEKN